ncbi:MAG: fasciclin domain-containing protein [Anaerolinea sp.]|nr:fasciclin domain-containing protein [Anaerolinea sp.]
MKKFLLFVTLIALSAFAVMPSVAQDEQTIAEIVVASTEAETPEFTTLLAAVSAADPAVLEALSDPEAELTVFAPTDAAFAALAEALGEEAFNGVLADQEALTGILLFHVLGSVVTAEDVAALFGEEMEPGVVSVETLNGQSIDIALDEEGVITINGAGLVTTDIMASNGVIHVIDAVILPETKTLAEVVVAATEAETPEFTTLLAAVSAADPAVLEALSNPDAELTVFAPTDAAFAALAEALGEEAFNGVLADQEQLTNILLYHVVEGVFSSTDVAAALAEMMDGVTLTMLNGDDATITVTEEGVFINDAQIIMTDIDAANGVIHVIDAVILPPM